MYENRTTFLEALSQLCIIVQLHRTTTLQRFGSFDGISRTMFMSDWNIATDDTDCRGMIYGIDVDCIENS